MSVLLHPFLLIYTVLCLICRCKVKEKAVSCNEFRTFIVRKQPQKLLCLAGEVLEEPEGFPTHVSFRKGNKTAIMAAARETKGHYGRRTANRRGVTPRGRETPSAPPGLVPLRGGTVFSSAWETKRALWPSHTLRQIPNPAQQRGA